MGGRVTAVSRNERYGFSKPTRPFITLLAGLGVEGDVHAGTTIRHQFRMTYEPDLPNLRQVHLMHEELFEELVLKGFDVSAGRLGENITTAGVDLLGLPTGALLRLGEEAVLEVTGLRNPCAKINDFRQGLLAEVFALDPVSGGFTFKSGVMAVVRAGGTVRAGDTVEIELPPPPHRTLERV
ncbi:MOSC domain-containing protein [Streptomyces anulatus]|uniref:MOSC domain-containing protein n=1 Tax=Streptomyces anulatus TaxID=1892 RepID=UPI0032559E32|nr:MOSC domain-containing protein [Streptomyces anulatus]WSU33850.1 MOSC domain-containing protein [Streptomyces anulatus]WSU87227.1 MOSC domain-containing protein [Streptomyces anulatus]